MWSELPIGRHRAEMGAWVNRKMSGAGATAEDMTKLEGLKRLLEAIPEESDWHYIDVYLHCRVEGGRVRLSQEQKEAIGDVNKVKAITKCDEFTTFGKRGGSITEHTTAVELLEGHASPPRGSWGVTSKCISFAQDLAKDVHNTKKVYVTREAAGQFMRRFGEEVENGRDIVVRGRVVDGNFVLPGRARQWREWREYRWCNKQMFCTENCERPIVVVGVHGCSSSTPNSSSTGSALCHRPAVASTRSSTTITITWCIAAPWCTSQQQ